MITFYVYKLVNMHDGSFYYGSRKTKLDPYDDLGISYFTSSKTVRSIGFENFYFCVIETFGEFEPCYWREQELICASIGDPGSLNRSYYRKTDNARIFSMSGKKQTPEHIRKRTLHRKGVPFPRTAEWQEAINAGLTGIRRGPMPDGVKEKISRSKLGKGDSDETKAKKSAAHKGTKKPWVKGTPKDKITSANAARAATRSIKSSDVIEAENKKISAALKGVKKTYITACSQKFICRISDRKEFSKASASKYMKDLKTYF